MHRRRSLPLFPALTVALLLAPIGAGLLGAILPAFGYFPAAGLRHFSTHAFADLWAEPGLVTSIWLSVWTGVAATLISLTVSVSMAARWSGTALFRAIQSLLSPLLSVPHAAAALGIAFLIGPSGWIARLISPWATGWDRPIDALIQHDPFGLSLIAGLVAKEIPFLFLMMLAALGQVQNAQSIAVVQALGYERTTGWLRAVFPRVYAQIRMPVFAVLAYSMSTVDVALVLGPTTPATLSVRIVQWMGSPDILMRAQAASGALLQLALVAGAILVWRLGETIVAHFGMVWVVVGRRRDPARSLAAVANGFGLIAAVALVLGLVVLALWSVAGFWAFPSALPDSFVSDNWQRHWPAAFHALGRTLSLALGATGIALVLVIGCLQTEANRHTRPGGGALIILYLPLLVPQTAFLPGLQTLLIYLGINGGYLAVMAAHLVFVLPYVFLSLSDAWRAWDDRFSTAARTLGAGRRHVFWRVKLPMLLRPVLTAAAVGTAVSVGQYLPTLLVGGGRVATLTTEALALAAGGDRRAIGVFGILQTATALLPFALAIGIPAFIWRNRRAMRHD